MLPVITAGRAAARRLMQARCVVRRKTGEATVNFTVEPTWEEVYRGPCKRQSFRPQEGERGSASQATRTVTRSEIHFPVGVYVPVVGDVITILASPSGTGVGQSYRVVDGDEVTEWSTALHVPVTRDASEDTSIKEAAGW